MIKSIKKNRVEFSIVIPAYNEQKSIRHTIDLVKETMDGLSRKYEIVVVNDGSKDRTAEIISSIEDIKVLHNRPNQGYGASLKKGILSAEGEWIVITDADGTYPVQDIPRLVKYTTTNDMVVGARTGKNVHVPLLRRPAKFALSIIANFLVGKKIPDLNSGLRIFKRDIAMTFFHLFPDGFSFTTTITMACLTNKYSVKYIPINYYKRKGKSTMSPFNFITFITLMFKLIMFFNPMKILLPLSAMFFVLGAMRGVRDFLLTDSLGTLSLMLFLVSFQVFILGSIAEVVIKHTSKRRIE